jgi:hypothetical protein
MATGARKQLNFYVADLYLKLCLKAKAKKKEFVFPFFHSLVKLYCIKAKHATNVLDNVDKFAKALKFIEGKNVRIEPPHTYKSNRMKNLSALALITEENTC